MAAAKCLFWCRQADVLSNFPSFETFKSGAQITANKTIYLRITMLSTSRTGSLERQNPCSIWTRGTHEANAQDNSCR